jgi:hypothetical protein
MDRKVAVAKILDAYPSAVCAHHEESNILEVSCYDSAKIKALFGNNPNVLTVSDSKVCVILDLI